MTAEKTGGQCRANGLTPGEQTISVAPDFDSTDAERKAFTGLQAAYALRGYALLRLADGVMLAERWGCTRQLDTMTQAAQFLHQIGGQ